MACNHTEKSLLHLNQLENITEEKISFLMPAEKVKFLGNFIQKCLKIQILNEDFTDKNRK